MLFLCDNRPFFDFTLLKILLCISRVNHFCVASPDLIQDRGTKIICKEFVLGIFSNFPWLNGAVLIMVMAYDTAHKKKWFRNIFLSIAHIRSYIQFLYRYLPSISGNGWALHNDGFSALSLDRLKLLKINRLIIIS